MTEAIEDKKQEQSRLELRFRIFFLFSAIMLAGLCGLTFAEFYLEPSIQQEFLGLICLIISGLGGLGTIIGYLAILWHRLRGFFSGERE